MSFLLVNDHIGLTINIFIISEAWVHILGDQKGQYVSAFDDNDITVCLTQDTSNPLLLKAMLEEFSSVMVIVVSNQDYRDPRRTCAPSSGHPWLLMTHAASDHASTCDTFCGPLTPCLYDGLVFHNGNLFWHRMKCDCGTEYCNELALHIVSHQLQTLSICDLQFA